MSAAPGNGPNTAPNTCPGEQTLAAFVAGALPADEASTCAAHVANCARCSAQQEELRAAQRIEQRVTSAKLNERDRERIARWTERTLAEMRQVGPPGCSAPPNDGTA